MNLLFGSPIPEELVSIEKRVNERYGTAPTTKLSNALATLQSNSDAPVGSASNASTHVALIGILNHSENGLASDANADAQTALKAYKETGIRGIVNLQGQYLIAVYDDSTEEFALVPDPNGLRTAYYRSDGPFAFCTNLKTLADGISEPPSINTGYQNFMLSYGFMPFGKTLFKGIDKLHANQILSWKNGNLTLTPRTDYSIADNQQPFSHLESLSEEELIDELHQEFTRAMCEQMSPDKKVGVLLGGFDSALVAAYLAAAGKEVHTYSFGYSDQSYNQAHTDAVASHTGSTHHWIPMTAEIIEKGIQDFDLYFNAPTNWANYVIQTKAVCQQMRRDGIRHVYSGDGCDSVFLGYPYVHKTSVVFDKLGLWPASSVSRLCKLLDQGWLDRILGRPYAVGMHLIRSIGRDMPQRGLLTFQIMDANTARRIQGSDYVANGKEDNESLLKKLAEPFKGKTPDRIAYGGKGLISPNLSKMIGSSDSTGTVIQAPYLHPRLKQLALHLPDELCRPSDNEETKVTGKYILMRMAEKKGLLPRDAIYQKKVSAVDAPLDEWLKVDLREQTCNFLNDLPFSIPPKERDALLRKKPLEELHRKYVASDNLTVHALSLLLSYSRFTKGPR